MYDDKGKLELSLLVLVLWAKSVQIFNPFGYFSRNRIHSHNGNKGYEFRLPTPLDNQIDHSTIRDRFELIYYYAFIHRETPTLILSFVWLYTLLLIRNLMND